MTGINRRHFLLSTGAALASASLSSLSFAQSKDAGAPRRGGTLNMLINPEPPVLVSIFQTTGPALVASSKVLEGLLAYDFDLKPKPQLATAWKVADDGLKYTFTLRENVKWHDGQPFTSADVAFSIDLLKSVHPRGRSTFANVTRVSTPDARTAVIELAKPAPYLLKALSAGSRPSCRSTCTHPATRSRIRTTTRPSARGRFASSRGRAGRTSSTSAIRITGTRASPTSIRSF